jgi:pimeloyl-ACP methyl ester carboxylesterase
MFSDWREMVYPQVAVTLGRVLAPKPADPDDVRISLAAARAYEGGDRLDDVAAPTLVFGGTDDPFFPESVLRETAAGIPEAELTLVRGGKHGAFHERKPAVRFPGARVP